MPNSVCLFLKTNGADVKGDGPTSLGREDSIECLHYEQAGSSPREVGTGQATGRRQYQPLLIRKRIDKSSPLILKAFAENQNIDGIVKFFRPNPSGDGTTEQFYTVTIAKARVVGIKQFVTDMLMTPDEPPLEEVSFAFGTITWTYTNGGVTHQDSWQGH